jgi:tRNA (guanine-N7-)-methyltransferase
MSRTKLRRFEENKSFAQVVEPSRDELINNFYLKGNWKANHFESNSPITIELGCGKGEYTVALARKYPEKSFIGVDIKGSRLWRGAKTTDEEDIKNASFLRCQIELIDYAFGENEVDEIWITFPDPQIKFRRSKHRLTAPNFLNRYRRILKPDGKIHLKTDSEFLHGYTQGVIEAMGFKVHEAYFDIDRQQADQKSDVHQIRTHYEGIFREKGKAITYLECSLSHNGQ